MVCSTNAFALTRKRYGWCIINGGILILRKQQYDMKASSRYLYGKTLKSIPTSGLLLTETAYSSDIKLPHHAHELAYFCFVIEGGFTESYDRRERLCRPSTLVFHPVGETHADCFHAETRCFNIQIKSEWLERAVEQHSNLINTPTDFLDSHLSFLAARLYREFREFDEFSSLVIEGLAIELIAEASRRAARKSKSSPPRWLRQTREILNERFDKNLTLVVLSEAVGVHPTHLAREFRRFYNCSVGEYVRRRRVEIASRQISKTNAPFAEIALAVGFFDQSHFARVFKSQTGMTPQEYRKSLRSPR